MSNDDLPVYCPACYSQLAELSEETYCRNPKCGIAITAETGYLTHDQWCDQRALDRRAWSEAEASGLIVPKTGEAKESDAARRGGV